MFVYSKHSSGTHKIYHMEQCPVVRRIRESHLGYFYTAQEAEDKGYRLCKVCQRQQMEKLQMRSIPEIYAGEQETAQHLCKKFGFQCELDGDVIYISNPIETWLIKYSQTKKRILIYHGPFVNKNFIRGEAGMMKKFHVQPLYFRSLEDTILAIYDHLASYAVRSDVPGFIKDRVWKLMGHGRPGFSGGKRKKKKKKKKKHPKNKSQMKYETKHVLDLIDSIQGKR